MGIFHTGPSFRVYTIAQAVLIAALTWLLTFRVSPTRAMMVTVLIMVTALAVSGISWSLKNKIPSLAAYVLCLTAELALAVPVANHPMVIRAAGQLVPEGRIDASLLAAAILLFLGCFSVWLATFVHSQVKELHQGWRTPLWGGPDRRKVIPLRLAG